MATLEETVFRANERDNVRIPKLNRLVEHLVAAKALLADPSIAALLALTGVADNVIYFTAPGAMALSPFPLYGRDLVDSVDASAARITLVLGSLAVLNTVNDANWSGADLEIANGGTGASSAAAARSNLNVFQQRTFTGTANEIAVSNGDGSAGNPTFSLPAALTFTGKTITGGVYASVASIAMVGAFSITGDFNATLTPSTLTSTVIGARPGSIVFQADSGTAGFGQEIIWRTKDVNTYIWAAISGNLQGNSGAGAGGHIDFSTKTNAADTTLSVRLRVGVTGLVSAFFGLDVTGESRCDSLRIDVAPTAAATIPTHTFPVNLNGTVYRVPCLI